MKFDIIQRYCVTTVLCDFSLWDFFFHHRWAFLWLMRIIPYILWEFFFLCRSLFSLYKSCLYFTMLSVGSTWIELIMLWELNPILTFTKKGIAFAANFMSLFVFYSVSIHPELCVVHLELIFQLFFFITNFVFSCGCFSSLSFDGILYLIDRFVTSFDAMLASESVVFCVMSIQARIVLLCRQDNISDNFTGI